MKRRIKRKPKLIGRFRHSHLINCGLRVDLHEDEDEWGRMSESLCYEILEASKEKLKIRVWHIIYEDNIGEQCEDSLGIFEIDLTAPYNKNNLKFIRSELKDGKK